MYVLFWKKPTPIFSGKTGYIMTWRGKQIAMCEEKRPLQEWIIRHGKNRQDDYYIEEFPN